MNKAYDQFVGRVPSDKDYCVNVTLRANLITMRGYITSANLEKEFSEYVNTLDLKAMEHMVETFVSKTTARNDPHEMHSGMMEIYKIVRFLTNGGDYIDNTFQTSAFYPEGSRKIWVDRVATHNWSLTPAYDLLAMHIMECGKGDGDHSRLLLEMELTYGRKLSVTPPVVPVDSSLTFFVPLDQLEYDIGMESKLREIGLSVPGKKAIGWRGKLQSFDHIMEAVDEREFPPILLKRRQFDSGKMIYEIIDGRHRTVAAVARGRKSIRCTLVDSSR